MYRLAGREETSYEFKCFVKDAELVPKVTREHAEAAMHPDSLVRLCKLPGITAFSSVKSATWHGKRIPTLQVHLTNITTCYDMGLGPS